MSNEDLLIEAKDILAFLEKELKTSISVRQLYIWMDSVRLPRVKSTSSQQGKIITTKLLAKRWALKIYEQFYKKESFNEKNRFGGKNIKYKKAFTRYCKTALTHQCNPKDQ